MTMEWIRFILGTGLLITGAVTFLLEIFGVFKFRYVLNRMQVAAMGDTLGIGASLVGLMILFGFRFVTFKLALVLIFLWCASPVSSHLISRLEYTVDEELDQFCEVDAAEKERE
ncbi:MAG: monovalent cation/H(+) antiporter subunit G [Lachnospiraceae bacterium]|nr:monovalent cation/H(+) antiporter subunit G [Lachnospiraceae bacterium]